MLWSKVMEECFKFNEGEGGVPKTQEELNDLWRKMGELMCDGFNVG